MKKQQERLWFYVSDNADVIAPDLIEELQHTINEEKMPEKNFGLWNIQNRLRQLEKDNPGICMKKSETGIFEVSFSIRIRE